MKNQWRVYLSLFFAFIIVIFAILNNQMVTVNYGFGQFEAPLVLIIFGSALIGAISVSFIATSATWRQKKKLKKLQKELANYHETFEAKVQERVDAFLIENTKPVEPQASPPFSEQENVFPEESGNE